MEKQKQHVFSSRTTEEGLKTLNELKAKLGVGWDDLVIDAVCAHYGLDRAAMSLPKKEAPAEEQRATQGSAGAVNGSGAKGKKAGKKPQKVEPGE
jgi:hypothetical protein